jgi:hypothetical protein
MPDTVADLANGASSDLAIDDSGIYYTAGSVYRVGREGGASQRISDTCFYPVGVALDATSAWFTCQDGTLRRVPKAGGATTTIAQVGWGALAVSDDAVFLADSPGGRVLRIPKAGGDPVMLAAGLDAPSRILIDTQSVWVTTRTTLQRIPR